MGSKAYSTAQMSEAIVLGSIIGAEAAGQRLHIQPVTIRNWMAKAGRKPADAISSADWASLGELARAQVMADLTSGKMTTVQKATVAAIATRNTVLAPPPVTAPTDVEAWADELERRLDQAYGKHADLAMVAALSWMDAGDPDADAPPVDAVLIHLASLGDLDAWHAAQKAARHDAMVAQLAANRQAALDFHVGSLDDDARRLLAAGVAYLATVDA